jgi:hypothetical protein
MGTLLLVMGPLVYMVMCCQYSLLRLGFIQVFTFRHHVVPHCTHSTSLLRNGAWACRFMAPICYNYLHVIRMQNYLASGQVHTPLLDPAPLCAGLACCLSGTQIVSHCRIGLCSCRYQFIC